MLAPRRPSAAERRLPAVLEVLARYRVLPIRLLAEVCSFTRKESLSTINAARALKLICEHCYAAGPTPALRRSIGLYLSKRAFRRFPNLRTYPESLATKPRDDVALWAYRRGCLHAALREDGYKVERSAKALLSLRRWLVDTQRARVAAAPAEHRGPLERVLGKLREATNLLPLNRLECSVCDQRSNASLSPRLACGHDEKAARRTLVDVTFACRACGTVSLQPASQCCETPRPRRHTAIDYDIAYTKRPKPGLPPVMIVLVDEPNSSLPKLLGALPLRITDQPKVPVVLRPYDAESLWSISGSRHVLQSTRFRRLTAAFNPQSYRGVGFDYSTTAFSFPYRPEVGQRTVGGSTS